MTILDSIRQYSSDPYRRPMDFLGNRGVNIPEWAQGIQPTQPTQPQARPAQGNTQSIISNLLQRGNTMYQPGTAAAQASGDSYNGWNALADILGAFTMSKMQ